ncbi:hypothetical protein F5X97DRAFT_333134 [Nemania serpens]|nr:hypothetical protein F5X97DRAFT_333134 [Nemania serpens]
MLAQSLLAAVVFAVQAFAVPASRPELVARQGYVSNCAAVYTVKAGDTCDKIRSNYGNVFDLNQFYSWNPEVNSQCTNLAIGEQVCVGVSQGMVCSPPTTAGIAANCNKCYKVVSGDTCQGVLNANHINLGQLRTWNPAIDQDCTNLLVGFSYCVSIA